MASPELGQDAELATSSPTGRRWRSIKASCQSSTNQVVTVGGLFILGSERHESRRIDNQLRGRAGRQGTRAPRALPSLEDD